MNELRIKYVIEKSPDYKRHYITNFWGGLTLDGKSLAMELSEDVPMLPDFTELFINDQGIITVQDDVESVQNKIRRHVHTGITIPCDNIPGIISWLSEKYAEYLQQSQSNNGQKSHGQH